MLVLTLSCGIWGGGGGGGGGGALVFSGILVNIFENLLGRGLMKILLRVKILVITSVF